MLESTPATAHAGTAWSTAEHRRFLVGLRKLGKARADSLAHRACSSQTHLGLGLHGCTQPRMHSRTLTWPRLTSCRSCAASSWTACPWAGAELPVQTCCTRPSPCFTAWLLMQGDWRGIAKHYVPSRTSTQVASHAQKYFLRQLNLQSRKRRSSLFDMAPDPDSVRPCPLLPVICQQIPNDDSITTW